MCIATLSKASFLQVQSLATCLMSYCGFTLSKGLYFQTTFLFVVVYNKSASHFMSSANIKCGKNNNHCLLALNKKINLLMEFWKGGKRDWSFLVLQSLYKSVCVQSCVLSPHLQYGQLNNKPEEGQEVVFAMLQLGPQHSTVAAQLLQIFQAQEAGGVPCGQRLAQASFYTVLISSCPPKTFPWACG